MLCLGQWPSLPTIPRTARTALAYLLPGPEKNWANAAPLNASRGRVFLFFHLQRPPLTGWSEIASQVALTYAASVIVGLAAQQAGRPDLIRSPKRVLAHLWQGDSQL